MPYLFQKYVKESHGKDIRVVVVGGQVIGSMLRCSTDGRMQSNCFLGEPGKAWGGGIGEGTSQKMRIMPTGSPERDGKSRARPEDRVLVSRH